MSKCYVPFCKASENTCTLSLPMICMYHYFLLLQDMLVFPEVLKKEELEELNHMVQPIEKFFTEGGK